MLIFPLPLSIDCGGNLLYSLMTGAIGKESVAKSITSGLLIARTLWTF